MFVISIAATAQTSVSGSIVDEKNTPVPFASVTIKNSKSGTKADENGRFTISVADG